MEEKKFIHTLTVSELIDILRTHPRDNKVHVILDREYYQACDSCFTRQEQNEEVLRVNRNVIQQKDGVTRLYFTDNIAPECNSKECLHLIDDENREVERMNCEDITDKNKSK